jgi:hypothetical protein
MWMASVLRRFKKNDENYARRAKEASEICKQSVPRIRCIDELAVNSFLRSSPSALQVCQLLTVLFYMAEIERRFGSKIKPFVNSYEAA